MSYVISAIALCASAFAVLVVCDIISVKKLKQDKFENYRDSNGLLGRKRNG